MRILAIETSTTAAGVAIVNDYKVETELYTNHKLQHSVMLFPMIEKALQNLSIDMDSIDSVVVSGGPGSFTGLRIGVATGKGLVQGTNRKFLGISSLDSLAYQCTGFNGIVCPILDALRENVYTATYKCESLDVKRLSEYDALHIDELLEKLKESSQDIMFTGDGVALHRDRIIESLGDKAHFASPININPRAASLGIIGQHRIENGVVDDIHTYAPLYIRKSQAEREYDKKHNIEG